MRRDRKRNLTMSTVAAIALLAWVGTLSGTAVAQTRINVDVKVIFATQNGSPGSAKAKTKAKAKNLSDYGLAQPLVKDLQAVLRYSSYDIIGQDKMNLAVGQTGSADLPGQRRLNVTPLSVGEGRAKLRLQLQRKNRQVFQTVIQLLNHGSLIVGGPKHKDGVLLFKVSNDF